ncbi:hypothetical protein Dtox_2692 [Desulfofarcimen acetoxidans DSM 771]|jgi:endogenous inhibitor of DNA gyrase (YacG/DUF329 family)|uniref:AraC family transcriptional regulator n=1 Tax=Desulfofarcimen acetoxidans (strain ATCC 49208 / DSM 771 / KCTC 5769 / VKM B-1644 / 5575) TaxID=485916 RepID=C8W175_DESAS|nr:CD1247 N-terminal domain-containing protein [Desulfofarcimen acetoxidans]ACV63471.1 hypothetical protein Dtox_2692 [Desulfofarcimen acetoxidans DSM 771]
MSDLRSRVAYLQGLSEGLDLDGASKEGKVLQGIIDVLEDIVDTMDVIEDSQEQMEEYMERIDEDLLSLEDDYYDDRSCTCEHDGAEYVEVDCPECGETVCFDSDILEDEDVIEVTCPSCDTVVFINDDQPLTGGNEMIEGHSYINKKSSDII